MAAYVVMEKAAAPGNPLPDAALVRDGFHWLAFLMPVFWLLWHRLWLEAALAFGVVMLLSALSELTGLGVYGSLLAILVSIYFGLEGAALRVLALKRRGWREWGVVQAADIDDAQARYAIEREARDEVGGQASPAPVRATAFARQPQPPTIGLVAYPGKL